MLLEMKIFLILDLGYDCLLFPKEIFLWLSLFQVAMDCLYEPNDVVPIAVGVALAVLIVVVLVAYIVGRRRNQARGYQSV